MKKLLKLSLEIFLDILYPPLCCSCKKLGSYLCPECFNQIEFYPADIPLRLEEKHLDRLISACYYNGPIKKLIKKLKYNSVKNIGKTLAKLLYFSINIPKVNCITYVPIHTDRLKARGFNQTKVIAKKLAKLTNTPLKKLLIKIKSTKNQAQLTNKTERKNNLLNSFQSNKKTSYRSILLLDDVTTTGSTLNECAKILKNSGVKTVIGLTVAHGI